MGSGEPYEIDTDKLYFNNNPLVRKLAIAEYPSLELANRQKDLNSAIDKIWKNEGFDSKGNPPDFYKEIFDVYNNNLHKAVSGVSEETAKLFKNNISRMAAAKTNYTIRLIERCKADASGVAYSKERYREEAKKVINRANRSQAAEYNTATHRTRVAKQWGRFEKERRLFPNIEWLRTRSADPRELHLTYVGRIWAMDDPFLIKNQPGCIWNCKCDWKNTDKPVTENTDIAPVPVSSGLEGNPYHTGEIFTDKHPYFSRVEKHIPDLGVLHNPDEMVFIKSLDSNGKTFLEHYNCRFDEELSTNRMAVDKLGEIGYAKEIKLLPQIHPSQTALRERYYGKEFQKIQKSDCPDALADQVLIEFKSGNKNTASKRILQASQKADVVYLRLTDTFTEGYLKNFINRQWERPDRVNLHTIIITNGNDTRVFKRI